MPPSESHELHLCHAGFFSLRFLASGVAVDFTDYPAVVSSGWADYSRSAIVGGFKGLHRVSRLKFRASELKMCEGEEAAKMRESWFDSSRHGRIATRRRSATGQQRGSPEAAAELVARGGVKRERSATCCQVPGGLCGCS